MIPTVTYTTRHRNIATVTTGGRSVTMTTLEVRTCPNCSREHELARLRVRQIAAEFAERGLPLPACSGYADTHTTRVQ